jgi:predicted transcriptional regulator
MILGKEFKTMGKTVTLTLDDMLYEKFKHYASMDNRSLANFFKTAAVQYIENKNLVDDFEMEEIRNNADLRERIRAGKRDAANRKGRFVD